MTQHSSDTVFSVLSKAEKIVSSEFTLTLKIGCFQKIMKFLLTVTKINEMQNEFNERHALFLFVST